MLSRGIVCSLIAVICVSLVQSESISSPAVQAGAAAAVASGMDVLGSILFCLGHESQADGYVLCTSLLCPSPGQMSAEALPLVKGVVCHAL